ncbi:MAG: hypothetical protein KC731_01390 [Myxococcales bacterium]|nr:hypothetical protein [Myxococcales bacterium]
MPPSRRARSPFAGSLFAGSLLVVGCAPSPQAPASKGSADPAYLAALETLCRAEVDSGAIAAFPYGEKGETLEAYVSTRVTHPEVRALYYETVLQSPVHHQERVLDEAAAAAGVEPKVPGGSSCPLAGYLGFLAKMPLEALTDEDCVAACETRNHGLQPSDRPSLKDACAAGCGVSTTSGN